ncbi:MAG: hypothetical protein S4CHLAM45_10730 [Chlamydiales bacterium]|nr:hypothetical protein [Chlamydiales bacterium]MCH9619566.1 hypothetical protein [Chlamydiales bacterium]MCH9623172.1 hypothetical protein [Chlamydiales bacterium]
MRWLIALFFISHRVFGITDFEALAHDLDVARHFDQKLHERFPVTFNNLLSTGYFVTPSSRMTCNGEVGFGVASAPPYFNWNGRIQPFPRLELSVNYRIFRGVEDTGLSPFGFGDYADRGANFKFAILTPEESMNQLPGLAFGIEDFMGSLKFTSYFLVATQVFSKWGLETSLGFGMGRYTGGPSRGFFGGFNWFPFWEKNCRWIRGIGVCAEYDPIDYSNPEREPNPHGRTSHSPINFGARYNYDGIIDLAVGQLRGYELAALGSLNFNWGKVDGLFPKTKDPAPYTSPKDREPLGCARPENVMVKQMQFAFNKQGFQIVAASIEGETLRLSVTNCRYIHERQMRCRLQYLLAALLPENIDKVVVAVESHGFLCQQYTYTSELLQRYVNCHISPYEFDVLTPRENVVPLTKPPLYSRRYDLWKAALYPDYSAFIGNRHGKYKYSAGLNLFAEGFLPGKIFYDAQANYVFASTLTNQGGRDYYNPSHLQNVATDLGGYINQNAFTWPKLYAQRAWNLGKGFFTRGALGYFQVNYGGIAGEVLWYPASSYCAAGIEGAVFKKRSYRGLGFQNKVRRFIGEETDVWRPYTTFEQYFLNFYLDLPQYQVYTKLSFGQFLARDRGGRIEFWRYFDSGLRLGGWFTITNANDIMHGARYFDRGVLIEIPLDLFYRKTCKKVFSTGAAAWLRDAGYSSSTGKSLFDVINRERRF